MVDGGRIMGFTWCLPPGESLRSYFKFIPHNESLVDQKPSRVEIERLEGILLRRPKDQILNQVAEQLVDLRELQKNWLLCLLPIYINNSFNSSSHLHCPKSSELLSTEVINLATEIYEMRSILLNKLRGAD